MNKHDILDNLEEFACWKEQQAAKGFNQIGPVSILAGYSEDYVKGFMRGQEKAYLSMIDRILSMRAELRDIEDAQICDIEASNKERPL